MKSRSVIGCVSAESVSCASSQATSHGAAQNVNSSTPNPPSGALPALPSLGMIGAGRMATALAKGCVNARLVAPHAIVASDPEASSRRAFLDAVPGSKATDDNREVFSGAEIVILAVKPQKMAEALSSLGDAVRSHHLVVSIAAGITLDRLASQLPTGARLVRVMPNTPCLIGHGASAFSRGPSASPADGETVKRLLQSVGDAYEVQESQLDAVTGLSGSGPAFVYTVVEALAEGGVEAGLASELAFRLAVQTVRGAAAMFDATGLSPAALRDQVTSPGGTTVAGLAALEKGGGAAAIRQAVTAAAHRSQELGRT